MAYQQVIYWDGDDAREALDILYPPTGPYSHTGATAESVAETVDFLRQWDASDPLETTYRDVAGDANHDVIDHDGYRVIASNPLTTISLDRIVSGEVESYRCPCCGDDVMDTRPVCQACREAGCKQRSDATGDDDMWWSCQRDDAA